MGDITLAEHGGQIWMVLGEEHIDALLFNDLPDGVAIQFVTCETRAAVIEMWPGREQAKLDGSLPWLINPLIADRIRNQLGLGRRSITFAPWSAMLDGGAQDVIAGAAAWLAENPGGRLLLRQFVSADPQPGQADLQRLRGQLVAGALSRAGVEAGRIGQEPDAAADAGGSEQLDIVTEAPGT